MSDLVQIVYVSRSTFTAMPAQFGIEPSVARILAQSRLNNSRRGLVGALYFGDGCFFQCLEGRAEAIDALWASLQRDPRHSDLQVLSRQEIKRTSFRQWSMKYVPLDAPMRALLRQHGLSRFDPYRFDEATVTQILEMLRSGPDVPAERTVATASPVPGPVDWVERNLPWVLALAALALVFVGVAWMWLI